MVQISRHFSRGLIFTTAEVTLTKPIPASLGLSKANFLSVLQNPDKALRLSPLVTDVRPEGGNLFTLTERLPLFGGILPDASTSYSCTWTPVEDGGDGVVDAAAGTELDSQMRIRDGPLVFEEKLTIKGLTLFMPFIKDTAVQAHIDLQDRVIEAAQRELNALD